jgi:hypothetical protein
MQLQNPFLFYSGNPILFYTATIFQPSLVFVHQLFKESCRRTNSDNGCNNTNSGEKMFKFAIMKINTLNQAVTKPQRSKALRQLGDNMRSLTSTAAYWYMAAI